MSQSNVTVPPAETPAPPAQVAAPSAPATPATQPAVPTVSATAAPAEPEASWLKGRLEQAERQGLKRALADLGVANIDDAKKILATAKAAEEAQKTELQKAREEAAALKPQAARVVELESAVKAQADAQLAALTEEQRSTVADIIGDDPATILKKLPKLKASWVVTLPPTAPTTPAAPKPVAAPASTTAATPPPISNPTEGTNHLDVWMRLKTQNPLAATTYYEKHQRTICAQIETRRKK